MKNVRKKIILIKRLIILVLLISVIIYIYRITNIIKNHQGTENNLPNIILISLDTLRADHLSCYGYKRTTTPNIDKFAQNSFVFTDVYSQSHFTFPSHVSIFTGLYPSTVKIWATGIDKMWHISDKIQTIGTLFKNMGYRTAGFTDGGLLSRDSGFDRGFEIYTDKVRNGIKRNIDDAFRFINSVNKDDSFFIFLHTYDIHFPYHPAVKDDSYRAVFDDLSYQGILRDKYKKNKLNEPIFSVQKGELELTEEDSDFLERMYDSSLFYVDKQLGRLFQYLQEKGYMKNTIIIITSDHGEIFRTRDTHKLKCFNKKMINHLGNVHEMLKIPLIIYTPQGMHKINNKRINGNINIIPTLFELINRKLNLSYQLDGKSVFSLKEQIPISFCYEYGISVCIDKYQYIIPWTGEQKKLYFSIIKGDYRRYLEEKNFYRLYLDKPSGDLDYYKGLDTNIEKVKEKIKDIAIRAANLQTIPDKFNFTKKNKFFEINYSNLNYIWQFPGTKMEFEPVVLDQGDWKLNIEEGIWSVYEINEHNPVKINIKITNQFGNNIYNKNNFMLKDMKKNYGNDGIYRIRNAELFIPNKFHLAGKIFISISVSDFKENDVFFIYKMNIRKLKEKQKSKKENSTLKTLGYLHN